MKQVPEIVT